MKLFNQFNILPRYLTAFNYAGLNLNEAPKELEKCTPEFQNFWEKECREHPTNQNCLIYCDWVINFKFLLNSLDQKNGFTWLSDEIILKIIHLDVSIWLIFFLFKFQDYRVRVRIGQFT